MTPRLVKPIAGSTDLNGDDPDDVSTAAAKSLAEKVKQEFSVQRASRAQAPFHVDRSLTLSPKEPARLQAQPSFIDMDDDERMPIPSTWRALPAPEPQSSWFMRQLTAGLIGFVLGLAMVIPTVLWLTGHFGGALQPKSGLATALTDREMKPRTTATAATASASAPVLVATPQPVARSATVTTDTAAQVEIESLLTRAREMIAEGSMIRARQILDDRVLVDNPQAAYALAETFDPNILAATGARDVRAEVERARTLYGKALAGGVEAARNRLQALN